MARFQDPIVLVNLKNLALARFGCEPDYRGAVFYDMPIRNDVLIPSRRIYLRWDNHQKTSAATARSFFGIVFGTIKINHAIKHLTGNPGHAPNLPAIDWIAATGQFRDHLPANAGHG